MNDVYNMCASVLTQFGETIPESVSPEAAYNVTVETLRMYGNVFNNAAAKKVDLLWYYCNELPQTFVADILYINTTDTDMTFFQRVKILQQGQ